MAARYWCHMCSKMVNPIIDAEIKCPFCQSGFIEEMSGEINGGSSSSIREVQDPEIDFGTDRALSLWGPIFLGMMSNPRRRRRFRRTEFGVDNDDEVNGPTDVDGNDNVHYHHHRRHHRHMQHDGEIDLDREFESIPAYGFSGSRSSAVPTLEIVLRPPPYPSPSLPPLPEAFRSTLGFLPPICYHCDVEPT